MLFWKVTIHGSMLKMLRNCTVKTSKILGLSFDIYKRDVISLFVRKHTAVST